MGNAGANTGAAGVGVGPAAGAAGVAGAAGAAAEGVTTLVVNAGVGGAARGDAALEREGEGGRGEGAFPSPRSTGVPALLTTDPVDNAAEAPVPTAAAAAAAAAAVVGNAGAAPRATGGACSTGARPLGEGAVALALLPPLAVVDCGVRAGPAPREPALPPGVPAAPRGVLDPG